MLSPLFATPDRHGWVPRLHLGSFIFDGFRCRLQPFFPGAVYLQPSPNLDLNSQADNFPFLDAYSGYLQLDGGHSDNGTPLGRGSRSRLGEFLPPRPSGARNRGGRGSRGGHGSKGGDSNSLNIGSRSDGQPLGMAGGGRGRLLANLVGCGSTGVTSSSLPTEDAGGRNGIAEDDNGSQMVRYSFANIANVSVVALLD
jgi:hypothetical protein